MPSGKDMLSVEEFNVRGVFSTSEAQLIVPEWGDKVDYGIVLSYRLSGRYDVSHRRLFPSVRDYEFGYNFWVSFGCLKSQEREMQFFFICQKLAKIGEGFFL